MPRPPTYCRVAALLAACLAGPARAAALDDYIAAGYVVVDRTTLEGAFTGCEVGRHLLMADGTDLACTHRRSQIAYRPTVTLLARPPGPPSALLIGGQPYAGALMRWGARAYRPPLSITADPPAPPQQAAARGGIHPITPEPGIDQIGSDARLNDAQKNLLAPGKRGQTLPTPVPLRPLRAPM